MKANLEALYPTMVKPTGKPANQSRKQSLLSTEGVEPQDDLGAFLSQLDTRVEAAGLNSSPVRREETDRDLFSRINQVLPIGDRLRSVDRVITEINPVTGLARGMAAAEEGNVIESATETLGALPIPAAAATAVAMRTARLFREALTSGAREVPSVLGNAVIRLDDTFRGVGPIRTSIAETSTAPYAMRTTAQPQIDDMIATGVIRPPETGYQGRAIIYFGEAQEATPNSVFTRPNASKPYTIVTLGGTVAGREGPISLDEVLHIWTTQNGELVDVLPDILRQNREYRP